VWAFHTLTTFLSAQSNLMTVLAAILIALPIILAAYSYVLYPVTLWSVGLRERPQTFELPAQPPLVTVVIPAFNEEAQVGGAIEALLAQDYPAARRQILILSDASSDSTDDIVREYSAKGVELLRMPTRLGKTAAENASVSHIRGEIVINSDASIRLHPGAVSALVAAMTDPTVGVASTRDVSVTAHEKVELSAEAGYVGYEMLIRSLETRAHGIVGASGSGYAIRTALHRHPVRKDLSRDFSAALTAQRHGFRAVAVSEAIAFVPRTASLRSEYRRKVRTISRGMDTLYSNRDLLDPLHHGAFAWKLLSHKLCRWLVPLSIVFAATGLLILSPFHVWSRWMLGVIAALGVLAIVGARWPDSRPLPALMPIGIVGALAANLAVVHAAWRFFHGHEDHVWEPTRRSATASDPGNP